MGQKADSETSDAELVYDRPRDRSQMRQARRRTEALAQLLRRWAYNL